VVDLLDDLVQAVGRRRQGQGQQRPRRRRRRLRRVSMASRRGIRRVVWRF